MKQRQCVALAALVVVALVTAPVGAAGGGRARAGATQYPFHLSGDVQPVPPYGSIDIPGSSGKLIVNQPEGEVSVVLTAIFDGLLPTRTYRVYIMNYAQPGASGWTYTHRGPWTLMATFTTDEFGHGDWHLNIRAGDLALGTYNLSVWINDGAHGLTLLISDNFEVVIE